MNRTLNREQRMLAAAAASILFVISLFFPWFEALGVDVSGQDAVPSWWFLLIFAVVSAALLAADALNFDVPAAIDGAAWAAYLTSVTFIVTLMIFLEGDGRKFGVFLAVLFALVAMVLSVMHWRDERGHGARI